MIENFAQWHVAYLLDDLAPFQPAVPVGLSERVLNGLKRCDHCYESCLARTRLAAGGELLEVCTEAGWEKIGHAPQDFADVRTVLGSF